MRPAEYQVNRRWVTVNFWLLGLAHAIVNAKRTGYADLPPQTIIFNHRDELTVREFLIG